MKVTSRLIKRLRVKFESKVRRTKPLPPSHTLELLVKKILSKRRRKKKKKKKMMMEGKASANKR